MWESQWIGAYGFNAIMLRKQQSEEIARWCYDSKWESDVKLEQFLSLSMKGIKSYLQTRLLNKSERLGKIIVKIFWIWKEYNWNENSWDRAHSLDCRGFESRIRLNHGCSWEHWGIVKISVMDKMDTYSNISSLVSFSWNLVFSPLAGKYCYVLVLSDVMERVIYRPRASSPTVH